MATKTEKALNRMQKARASAARRRREERHAMRRRMYMVGSGAALGWADREGWLDRLPSLGGVPRVGVLGGAALAASYLFSGPAGDVLEGIADAGLTLGAYGLVRGEGVIGATDDEELAQLTAELQQLQAEQQGVSGADDYVEDSAEVMD